MLPFPTALFGGASRDARLIYNGRQPTGTLASLGVAVDDLLIVTQKNDGQSSGGPPVAGSKGPWTLVFRGYGGGGTFTRLATSADLAAAVASDTGADFALTVHRGARTLAQRSTRTAASSSANYTLDSFPRDPRHAGLLLLAGNNNGQPANLPTAPATWTQRYVFSGGVTVSLFDRLAPPNTRYASGAMTMISVSAGSNLTLFELLR